MMDSMAAERIRTQVTTNDVVLYMKGTPVFPQCGFSAQAVQILGMLGVPFKGVDVLADPSLRQGIKDFSNWPTIPQLYIKGEFVGGSDIMREMFQSGELQKAMTDKGVPCEAPQKSGVTERRHADDPDKEYTYWALPAEPLRKPINGHHQRFGA